MLEQNSSVKSPSPSAESEPLQHTQSALCPICRAPAQFWKSAPDRHYGNPGLWDAYRCQSCRHIFQSPEPGEEALAKFYPDTYYAYQPPATDLKPRGLRRRRLWLTLHYLKRYRGYRHLGVSSNPLLARLGRLLLPRPHRFKIPPFQADADILDYGCGAGASIALLQFLGWRAEGIEMSPAAAKAGQSAGLKIHCGSIEVLEQFSNRYDCIMSSHCVEHVPDVRRLLAAFHKALKPGGKLFIDVPNGAADAVERYGEFYYYLGFPVHVHLFTPQSMSQLANETGFANVTTDTYSVWMTQSEAALAARKAHSAHPGSENLSSQSAKVQSFHKHGRSEEIAGRLQSLPGYLQSKAKGRGDCLLLSARKPENSA